MNLIIGSHVSFNNKEQLLGSVKEALSYNANTFMIYTGSTQSTSRSTINDEFTYEAYKLMLENNIDSNNVIVHAPYIINLANRKDEDKYLFYCDFLANELDRCKSLGLNKIVLHPGSATTCSKEEAIKNINTDNKNHALFFDKNKGRVHACFGAKQGAAPSYSDKQLEERLIRVISEYAYDVENANVIFDIFMYFYKEYELRFGRKHPILSDMTYEKIIKSYYEPVGDEISNTDIDINEHRKMVDLYFDTDYNKRGNYNGEIDKSLQHFFSGQIRNHLLMRVRDCEDYV